MYTLATDYGSEGWQLDEFESKELLLTHISKGGYGRAFKIFGPEIKLDLISNDNTNV